MTDKLILMDGDDILPLYAAFGHLVQQHRRRKKGMTQEELGRAIGLSRTSITNIEKGRQHASLHQLFAIAEALGITPDALLPTRGAGSSHSWVTEKLPPGTDKAISEWAAKVAGK